MSPASLLSALSAESAAKIADVSLSSQRAVVVGSPIAHSLSPTLHRAAYAALGLAQWRFDRAEVLAGGLERFLAAEGQGLSGLAVTMPLKREALALASETGEAAQLVGAANTLLRRDGGWRAENTDAPGMVDALRAAGAPVPARALVIGAGGTAQAALVALAELAVREVVLAVRSPERAGEALATGERAGLAVECAPLEASVFSGMELIVSTLPSGVADRFASAPWAPGALLFDVVYVPWPTLLARGAQERGVRIVSGLELLLRQAGHQVRLMTGCEAPLEAMRYALGENYRTVR